MRTRAVLSLVCLLIALAASAQESGDRSGMVTASGPGTKRVFMVRHEMGKWWKDSEIAKKLQLNDSQIAQLDDIFYQHRLKLIDYGAAMEKEDLKLQNLLDADVPNEGQINAQVDQVLAARGKLEREYTFMNLDLRKVLSLEQWRQLKQIRAERGLGDNVMYFNQRFRTGPGAPGLPEPPMGKMPPGPPPPPPPDDSF